MSASADLDAARRLLAFCDTSPSPFHACATAARMLDEAGFTRLAEDSAWPRGPGRWYVVRGGTLVAWIIPDGHKASDGFRIVGAHTDSPNLRIKPQAEVRRSGFRQLGVEVYGAALLTSWLDRDLGVCGRVSVRRNGGGAAIRLLRVDRPVCYIPQLAIHLNREVNQKGLLLDPQQHLMPIWGLDGPAGQGSGGLDEFQAFVADALGVGSGDVLGWDLMLHDLAPASLLGRDHDFIGASRLDNLASCWAAIEALIDVSPEHNGATVPMVCLFDHEEVGSVSDRGAGSSMLPTIVERTVLARDGDREILHQALARSASLSADMAHATHPNYADRHDPQHRVRLNGGPVIKVNAQVRYATDAPGTALVELAADQAGIPLQRFAMRSDLPCGSTIGPVTASRLGITTVDVGMPQLAMHAARELAGSHDGGWYRDLLMAFLNPTQASPGRLT